MKQLTFAKKEDYITEIKENLLSLYSVSINEISLLDELSNFIIEAIKLDVLMELLQTQLNDKYSNCYINILHCDHDTEKLNILLLDFLLNTSSDDLEEKTALEINDIKEYKFRKLRKFFTNKDDYILDQDNKTPRNKKQKFEISRTNYLKAINNFDTKGTYLTNRELQEQNIYLSSQYFFNNILVLEKTKKYKNAVFIPLSKIDSFVFFLFETSTVTPLEFKLKTKQLLTKQSQKKYAKINNSKALYVSHIANILTKINQHFANNEEFLNSISKQFEENDKENLFNYFFVGKLLFIKQIEKLFDFHSLQHFFSETNNTAFSNIDSNTLYSMNNSFNPNLSLTKKLIKIIINECYTHKTTQFKKNDGLFDNFVTVLNKIHAELFNNIKSQNYNTESIVQILSNNQSQKMINSTSFISKNNNENYTELSCNASSLYDYLVRIYGEYICPVSRLNPKPISTILNKLRI